MAAIFDGDDSRLMAAVKRIDKSLLATQAKFAKFGIAAARWFAAPAAATVALGLGIRKALDVGGHFADLSATTGIAIEDLVVLEQEFKNAGKAGEDVAGVIAKMQDVLVSGAANDTLEKLGLNLAELRKQTPLEQFRALGSAIDKMADANERVAAARAFFGRSGASLLSMFSAKGFGDAAKQVGIRAQILERDAALFDDVSDKHALAGTKLTGFFIGVADRVVPVLKPLIELCRHGLAEACS